MHAHRTPTADLVGYSQDTKTCPICGGSSNRIYNVNGTLIEGACCYAHAVLTEGRQKIGKEAA